MTFQPGQQLDAADVDRLVDEAIEENEVVVFIKGNRLMPQCGFSQRALQLLAQHRADFEAVDTLQALDAFRVALERHSGWETIPQAYVDGEFVGGSDILAELHERGELADTLNAA